MSFINNLFGTIAGNHLPVPSNMDFIPVQRATGNGGGNTVDIKGDNAVWMGLRNALMQKAAYDYCYPVAAVTDKLAFLDTTGTIEILRKGGKGKNNFATGTYAESLRRIFSRPNKSQSWFHFRGQQLVFKRVHGYCPVLPIVPAGFGYEEAQLINLPPWLFDVKPNQNVGLYSTDVVEKIEKYVYTYWGKTYEIQPDKIMILEDSFMYDELKHFLLPQSKLVGLDMQVSNVCAALEADNVLLRKKGPLGFVSHDGGATKDFAGYLPMTKEQKSELQGEFGNYGLSLRQFQYVISRVAAKWNPMSFDVNQLGTKETVIAGEKAICHRYDLPYVLFEVSESTFANGGQASKNVYTNTVIPNADKDFQKYSELLKCAENNVVILNNFEYLPVMQEDKKMSADAAVSLDNALEVEYANDIITKNQWLEARGYDTVPDGDKYKSEYGSTAPPPPPTLPPAPQPDTDVED